MEAIQVPVEQLVCDICWGSIFSPSGWAAVLAGDNVPGSASYVKGYAYNTTWEAIRAAADKCTWCRFLARPKRKGDIVIRAACYEKSDCTPAGEKMLSVVYGDSSSGSRYYMYTNENDNAAKFVAARERIRDISAPNAHPMALKCLENCVKHHTTCPKPREDTVLPDRLIDCTDTSKPKLVLTRGQRGRYLALSYVWGASQPMMTTTKNIDKYCREGLDMALFPQTIQDAVVVTHNLGERYLWIDAQCILQDSETDKARQLGMMCDIYYHSYFTIIAACADAATTGFLHHERPEKIPSTRIPYRCPDGSVGAVWISKWMDTDIADGSHSYWDEIEPISYRAWCLQERLLPSRSFIYASDTLKYYCQTETVNIGGALCEPSTGMRLPNTIYHPMVAPISDADRKRYRQSWLSVIFLYTLRKTSVPSDKLPALAGLAEQFHRVYQDDYLAGMWWETLLLDLLWSTERTKESTRPNKYRAPSWSWAAVDGLISMPYRELGPEWEHLDILHCHLTLKDPQAPFGEVTAGFLKVRGYLIEIRIKSDGSATKTVTEGQNSTENGRMNPDCEAERCEKAYVVPLLWSVRTGSLEGLAVVSTEQGAYRRVGLFKLASNSKKWLDDIHLHEITIV